MAAVYLHIGLPKTGTTALQNFLTDNTDALAHSGICFPDFGLRYPHISWRRNAHFLIVSHVDEFGNKDPKQPCEEYEDTLNQIADLAGQYDRILLSDEAIWQNYKKRPAFWPSLKEDFQKRGLALKVIVYLRRQDSLIESLYRQRVKASCLTDRFDDYIRKLRFPLDYLKYADMLSEVLGKENLILRVYDREQYQGAEHNIFSDFLDIFGLSLSDGFKVKQAVFNTSLDGSMLEFRRLVNRLPHMDSAGILNKSIDLTVSDYPSGSAQGAGSLFSPDELKAFLGSFAESNSLLAQKYLGREDGFLFPEPSAQLPKYSVNTDDLLRNAILVYGLSVQISEEKIKWLKRQILTLQQQNSQLRKELHDVRQGQRDVRQEFRDVRREFRDVRQELRDVRENVLWYRLKRKMGNLRKN